MNIVVFVYIDKMNGKKKRVAIFQNKVEFLVFYNSPSFLGIYNSKHHFNKVFYLIKQKTFWLRRLRSRFFKLYFYNKNTKFST